MGDIRETADLRQLYSHGGNSRHWHGSYLGFSFGGIHSSAFHIARISSSDRYTNNLLPTLSDKVVTINGNDGSYYFGTNYTSQTFPVNFAYDHLSDADFQNMIKLFSLKTLQPLIFDETPYKIYWVKPTNANITHICFDDPVEGRLYKGEGSVSFVCYDPYAHSRFKYLDDYTLENIPEWDANPDNININEWHVGSGIIEQGDYDQLHAASGSYVTPYYKLYNPGDAEAPWTLTLTANAASIGGTIAIAGTDRALQINSIAFKGNESYIKINTKTCLIEGFTALNQRTSFIYNEAIQAGQFFYLPKGESVMTINGFGAGPGTVWNNALNYDYLYI